MKKFFLTLIILLLISAAFFYAVSLPHRLGGERAVGGVLDLTEADFDRQVFGLDGEWEFFFGQLLTPRDFAQGVAADGVLINVPGSWQADGFPVFGFGTYRLIIKTDETSLLMFLPEILDSSVVWVNGEKVSENGVVGRSAEETVIGATNAVVVVTPVDGRAEIVAQAASFVYYFSGMNYRLEIGRPNLLIWSVMGRRILLGMFIGMLVTMSVYHAILFFYRRGEWVYAAFAVYCLTTAAQFLTDTNGLIYLLGYGSITVSGHTWQIYQVAMVIKGVSLVAFTHLIFGITLGKISRWLYAVLFGASFVMALVPLGLIDTRLIFIGLISMFILFIDTVKSKRVHGHHYNYLYVVALGFFCVWQPIQRFVFGDQLFMPAVGNNLFLLMAQFLMLSVSYAQAKESEQVLAAENAVLGRTNRLRAEMVETISHETRTPLAVLASYSSLVALEMKKKNVAAQVTADLNKIADEAKRVANLIDRVKKLPLQKDKAVQRVAFDMGGLAAQTADLYRHILERHGVSFDTDIPENMPLVYGSPEEITQVVFNLLQNAKNHTPVGGRISIKLERADGELKIAVADNGTGIKPDLLPRVFERGVHDDSGGSGIGLAICKEIIETHGGRIWIESAPGNGAKVTFTLPVYRFEG